MKFYRFGSKNSLDKDYLIDHPNATGTEKDKKLIEEIKLQYPIMHDWDINIIKIKDKKVVCSIPSKGNPDAVHNSLLNTYSLHEQSFECPLSSTVEREILPAINKCIDHILTFHKRTDTNFYNEFTRKALKSKSLEGKIKILSLINFNKLKLSEDEKIKIDSLKKITFHIAQTISLLHNKTEIYTKDDLVKEHPELSDIINRKPLDSYDILNFKIKQLEKYLYESNY